MTTTQVLGPYECHNAYRGLHFDADGVEWAKFLAEDNHPQTGDGAAQTAPPPRAAAAPAFPRPQPAPSPSTVDGGAR